jgi:hypothetical protein
MFRHRLNIWQTSKGAVVDLGTLNSLQEDFTSEFGGQSKGQWTDWLKYEVIALVAA